MNHTNELISEAVQEVMGRIPSWIERSGNMLILLTLIIVLSISAIIPFPDSVPFELVVDIMPEVIELSVSDTEKVVEYSFLQNNSNLIKGDTILVTQNIDNLKLTYYIAPLNGYFSILHQLKEGLILEKDEKFGSLEKNEKANLKGKVSNIKYGEIYPGQKCILHVSSGTSSKLQGFIKSKELLSTTEDFFYIHLELDEEIHFNRAMSNGTGKIIIKEKTLIQSILTFLNI